MLFNSLEYLVFFPLVVGLYFLLPQRARWAWLLGASCVFYMFFIPAYISILAVTIVIDYVCGIQIENAQGKARKRWLVLSIISTCAVLFVFKYFNFFTGSFAAMGKFFGLTYPQPILEIILPIGLSFHTFQSLSYVIEVYRGNQKSERHFGIYSLYVMFFPQLVAGPIERPQNLLHQFREKHVASVDDVAWGLKRIAWGVFKKVVIADRCAIEVNYIYAAPSGHDAPQLILATFLFSMQIYGDFSGYSDIAIGSARILGFRLMENFKAPYFSKSIGEFWRCWHISLSTWFKDYVYIPLGGNRKGSPRTCLNLFLTFILSGLWHGANWTYVIWGALNGGFQVVGKLSSKVRDRLFSFVPEILRKLGAWGVTFFLTLSAWVFFRASTFGDALIIWRRTVFGLAHGFNPIGLLHGAQLSNGELRFLLAMIVFMLVAEYAMVRGWHEKLYQRARAPLRWTAYGAFGFTILLFGIFGHNDFIYFQF